MIYSNLQKDIFKGVARTENSIFASAVAGSGKTTTLVKSVSFIKPDKDCIFLAFNKLIANELKDRIKRKNTEISTMHSFCWRNLMKSKKGKLELKSNKAYKSIEYNLKRMKDVESKKFGYYTFCAIKLLDLARQHLVEDPEDIKTLALKYDLDIDDKIVELTIRSLNTMNRSDKVFDFTDMIYRVILDEVRLPKYDVVFVDEAQDLSKSQQEIVRRIIKRNGRMIAFGDPRQAIYGFAGADSNSYNNLKSIRKNTVELPLSINYRCAKSIVKEAQTVNPQIQPFDGNKEGLVLRESVDNIKINDWVLCRNLKPLIILNLYLIKTGRRSYVRGSDLGSSLEKYIKSFKCMTTKGLLKKIDSDIDQVVRKMLKKGIKNPSKTEKVFQMNQRKDIIRVLADESNNVTIILSNLKKVFTQQKNSVVLSTIHKSKGLENPNVFILCPELIPSQYAEQPWQLEQEDNLLYVAITRAKDKLSYINDYDKVQMEILNYLKDD